MDVGIGLCVAAEGAEPPTLGRETAWPSYLESVVRNYYKSAQKAEIGTDPGPRSGTAFPAWYSSPDRASPG